MRGYVAGNGLNLRFRDGGGVMLSSHGCGFYQGKKTGKSNVTDFCYDNLEVFELSANEAACEALLEKEKREKEWQQEQDVQAMPEARGQAAGPPAVMSASPATSAPTPAVTGVVFKNISPEENLAQFDQDKVGFSPEFI